MMEGHIIIAEMEVHILINYIMIVLRGFVLEFYLGFSMINMINLFLH